MDHFDKKNSKTAFLEKVLLQSLANPKPNTIACIDMIKAKLKYRYSADLS